MADVNTTNANFTGTLDKSSILWGTSAVAFLAALNLFLSINASLGNIFILISLHKVSSLHPPTKLLFQSLAVTDLCVGLISHPLHAIYFMSYITKIDTSVTVYIEQGNPGLSVMLCGVSVLTSTAISVDRLLALLLRLRYRHVVTLMRVRAFTVLSWLIGVSCGSLHFWSSRIVWIVASVCGILCMLTSIFSYTKIYFLLRQHQNQIQAHEGQPNALNIERYKKTVSAISWIQVTLFLCYVPFCLVTILRINGEGYYMTWLATATLVFLNSSLNPILYCWKIREVRQALKDTIKQLWFCA